MGNLGLVGSRLLGLVTSRDFDFITDHDEKLKNVKFHSAPSKLFLIFFFFWSGDLAGFFFFLDSTKLSGVQSIAPRICYKTIGHVFALRHRGVQSIAPRI